MDSLNHVMKELMPNIEMNSQHWIQYFRQHPDLIYFLSTHSISDEMMVTSFNHFYQFIEEKENCRQCNRLESCPNMLHGHSTVLAVQNGQIQISLRRCEKLKRKEGEDYKKKLFKSQYVPEEILQATFRDIKQAPGQQDALAAILEFCKNYVPGSKQKGIYLYGPLGVGKSHMMAAAANKLAEKGISTLMIYVPDFFREMKSSIQDQTLNEKLEVLKKVQVLILDDIGAETISQWERDEILGAVLQSRMVKGLPTLYTSNKDYNSLEEHLSYSNKGGEEGLKAKRLMERIRHYTIPYFVDGPNRRISSNF